MKFIKYDGRPFSSGMIVKLGGRMGGLSDGLNRNGCWEIIWDNPYRTGEGFSKNSFMALELFPDLEIGIPEPTISKEAMKKILQSLDQEEAIEKDGWGKRKDWLRTLLASMLEKKN